MVSIDAFQALDPGSIPGHRTFFFFSLFFFFPLFFFLLFLLYILCIHRSCLVYSVNSYFCFNLTGL